VTFFIAFLGKLSQSISFSLKTTDLKEICILIIPRVQVEVFPVFNEPPDCEDLQGAKLAVFKKSIKETFKIIY